MDNNLKITSTKTRLIRGENKHILRIDSEKFQETFRCEKKLIKETKKNDIVV